MVRPYLIRLDLLLLQGTLAQLAWNRNKGDTIKRYQVISTTLTNGKSKVLNVKLNLFFYSGTEANDRPWQLWCDLKLGQLNAFKSCSAWPDPQLWLTTCDESWLTTETEVDRCNDRNLSEHADTELAEACTYSFCIEPSEEETWIYMSSSTERHNLW